MSRQGYMVPGSGRRPRSEGPARRLLAAALVFAVLGLWIPFSLFGMVGEGQFGVEVLVCLGILAFCVARCILLVIGGRAQLMALTFYLFVYIWVGVAGALQAYRWDFPWPVAHAREDVLPALMVIVVAVLAYETGRFSVRRRVARVRWDWQVDPRRVLWLALLSLPAVAFAVAYFGGLETLLVSREAFAEHVASGRSKMGVLVARALLRTPSLVALLLALLYTQRRWRTGTLNFRRRWVWICIGLVLLNLLTNFPPAQARYWLGAMLLTPLFGFWRWGPRHALIYILGLSMALLVIYPRADVYRRAENLEQALAVLEAKQGIGDKIFTGDFDVFQQSINAYLYYQAHGIVLGKNLAGAVLFFVPRKLWPGKPLGTGETIAADLGYRYTNLSGPLWAELLIAFGWLGVAVFSWGYGAASAWADGRFQRALARPSEPDVFGVLVPFVAAFQFMTLRGDLIVAMSHALFVVVLIMLACRRRRV